VGIGFITLYFVARGCVFWWLIGYLDWNTEMGVVGWDCSGLVLVVVCLILSVSERCNGGITSSYVRNDDLSLDMPLDSDVFRVPPGYNAPQQVCFCFCIKNPCLSITFIPGISLIRKFSLFLVQINNEPIEIKSLILFRVSDRTHYWVFLGGSEGPYNSRRSCGKGCDCLLGYSR
jgi:hypothetical protein